MNKYIYILFAVFALTSFASCGGSDDPEVVVLTSLDINPVDKDLYIGDTYQLTVSHQPADIKLPALTWKSSDTKVATVSSSGKITAVSDGVVSITASYGSLVDNIETIVLRKITLTKNFIVGTWEADAFGNLKENSAWISISPNKTIFELKANNTCNIKYGKNYLLDDNDFDFEGTFSISGNTVEIISTDNVRYDWEIIAIYENYIVTKISFGSSLDYRFVKK